LATHEGILTVRNLDAFISSRHETMKNEMPAHGADRSRSQIALEQEPTDSRITRSTQIKVLEGTARRIAAEAREAAAMENARRAEIILQEATQKEERIADELHQLELRSRFAMHKVHNTNARLEPHRQNADEILPSAETLLSHHSVHTSSGRGSSETCSPASFEPRPSESDGVEDAHLAELPLMVMRDYSACVDGCTFSVIEGDLVLALAPASEDGFVDVAQITLLQSGSVPIDILQRAPPHGAMAISFIGKGIGEAYHAVKGQMVWVMWRKTMDEDADWVPVYLEDGRRGNVPRSYVIWFQEDDFTLGICPVLNS
jgi:hypothetical protein